MPKLDWYRQLARDIVRNIGGCDCEVLIYVEEDLDLPIGHQVKITIQHEPLCNVDREAAQW